MGNSLSVRLRKFFQSKNEESWLGRVRQNAQAFFELRRVPALAHGGVGAFDLLEARPAPGTRKRQAVSLLVHGAVIGGLLLIGANVQNHPPRSGKTGKDGPLLYPPPLSRYLSEREPRGGGKGSNHDLLPPTAGELATHSQFVLIRPHLPTEQNHALLVEPTLYDPNATMAIQHRDLGLPWMKDKNNSNGDKGGDSIGTQRGSGMGSTDGDDEGEAIGDRYAPGTFAVKCLYCPDPEYTDEARHEKLQGSVTLRVLVTKDGRAGQIKIVKGLGLGLDERAIAAIQIWRFQPARDANKNAIAQWVTVETTYRLF
jgi:periplasmic protein TonB